MENQNKRKSNYVLFIDELGTANLNDIKSNFYILAGCSICEEERDNAKILADQIKFKYWNNTNIVFHSREIGRREGDFSILKDNKIFRSFLLDIERFLLSCRFRMFFVVVDKRKARELDWNHVKIYKETSDKIIRNFLLILLTGDSKGKIVIESATAEKDFYFHKALVYYLAGGIKELGINYKKVQETITSISFVTKNNFDIEEQISDMFAYAAKCYYLIQERKRIKNGPYEKMILSVFKNKLFKRPKEAKENKMKFFKEVESFLVLP